MSCRACVSYRGNDGRVESDTMSFIKEDIEEALRKAKATLQAMGYKVYHVVVVRV